MRITRAILAVVVSVLIVMGPARVLADTIRMDLSSAYFGWSGLGGDDNDSAWISATFSDQSDSRVLLTIENRLQHSSESLKGFVFNFNPVKSAYPLQIRQLEDDSPRISRLTVRENRAWLGPAHGYDVSIGWGSHWSQGFSGNGALQVARFELSGIRGLNVHDFAFQNQPWSFGQGSSNYFAAVELSGMGSFRHLWMGAAQASAIAPSSIPLPGPMVLCAIAILGLPIARRRYSTVIARD